MVKLFETDIKTKEVIKWKGLHVLHFQGSSCSQKLRIFLKEKNISWKSHHINLVKGDNFSDYKYLKLFLFEFLQILITFFAKSVAPLPPLAQ